MKQQYPDVVLKGRDLFDSSLFRDSTSTSVFYTFISKLKQSIDTVSPSPTHWFIKTLDNKGKLLRSYTQNIDGLEERVAFKEMSRTVAGWITQEDVKVRHFSQTFYLDSFTNSSQSVEASKILGLPLTGDSRVLQTVEMSRRYYGIVMASGF